MTFFSELSLCRKLFRMSLSTSSKGISKKAAKEEKNRPSIRIVEKSPQKPTLLIYSTPSKKLSKISQIQWQNKAPTNKPNNSQIKAFMLHCPWGMQSSLCSAFPSGLTCMCHQLILWDTGALRRWWPETLVPRDAGATEELYTSLLGTCVITVSRHTRLLQGYDFRLTDKRDLRVSQMKTRFGDRAFSASGPRYWNSLPSVLRAADSIDCFKTRLKTY